MTSDGTTAKTDGDRLHLFKTGQKLKVPTTATEIKLEKARCQFEATLFLSHEPLGLKGSTTKLLKATFLGPLKHLRGYVS